MSLVSLVIDTRLADSLGTWSTFLRTNEELILTSLNPAMVINEPSVVAIFLLLGQGIYVLNCLRKMGHVICGSRVNDWRICKCFVQDI